MLAWRLGLSAVLVPVLFLIFYLDHRAGQVAPFLLVMVILLAARSAFEMCALLRARSFHPHFPLVAACSLVCVAASWVGPLARENAWSLHPHLGSLGPILLAFALSVLVLFFHRALVYQEPGSNMETLGAEVLSMTYIGVLLSITSQLRWVQGAEAGYLVLGSLIISVKSGDIGAYTLGRLFGKRKMAPRLSPGKTWAGAGGAVLGASLGAILWLQLATPRFNDSWEACAWYWALLFGVIMGAVGLIGDLCESLIKRDVEKKDSAPLMPGFGGLLDLLDSVIYAGPVAYLLWLVLPLATWS